MKLIKRAERYGFLRRPCKACGQQMVVARSGKQCANCGHKNAAP
jgi:exosome complex RNA-binding protein Csl4